MAVEERKAALYFVPIDQLELVMYVHYARALKSPGIQESFYAM
jgi:hypothetical protein